MKLTGIKIDSRLFHLNSCLPFPKNTPAFLRCQGKGLSTRLLIPCRRKDINELMQ